MMSCLSDWDVAASPIDGQGKNLTVSPYLLVGLDGTEANTAIAYNSVNDQYAAIFDYYNADTSIYSHLHIN